MSDLEITDQNFDEYFFDVRKNSPKPGQVMVCYTATAEFVDGNLKRDITYLLAATDKVDAAVQLMRKLGWASDQDAIRICREVVEDLAAGKTSDEIAETIYKYQLKAYYYIDKENLDFIPKDDPHWDVIELKNLEEHVEKTEQGTIKTKIIFPENEEKENI
jgi:hypothetical protein